MADTKSVVIKLTSEQREAIRKATGKDIGELKVEGLEGRITPSVGWDAELRKAPDGFGLQETRKAPTDPFSGAVESRKAPTDPFSGAVESRKAPTDPFSGAVESRKAPTDPFSGAVESRKAPTGVGPNDDSVE